jgi:hypothetical protein
LQKARMAEAAWAHAVASPTPSSPGAIVDGWCRERSTLYAALVRAAEKN